MAKKKQDKWFKGVLLGLLLGVGSWALFQISVLLIEKPFIALGIVNPLWIYLSIVIVVILAVIIGWRANFKDAVKKLVR